MVCGKELKTLKNAVATHISNLEEINQQCKACYSNCEQMQNKAAN
jgi:hypothetical protein